MTQPKLLLHVCCGPCSTHVIETLKKDYDLTLYFYNPNIYPKEEYLKRLYSVKKVSKEMNVPLVIEDYEPEIWNDTVQGLENEPENGKRCEECFNLRLEVTAEYAKKNNYDSFTTTLTISPYKDAQMINKIGKRLEGEYGIDFLEEDFKKYNGYQRSIELSKQMGLYRQKYCGCIYSLNKSMESPNE